jgi:diketogulonate reductase-like aldo/keto reductase
MEKLLKTGKTKAIGVSNFNIRRLDELLEHSTIVPAVNQVEAHPYLQQPGLLDYCKQKGIQLAAYSPLGNNQTGEPRTVDDEKVHEIASRIGIDPGQLLISWGVQRGTVVLPKSVTSSRISSNFQDSILSDEVMKELNALERHKRFNFPARWGVDIYDEVGTDYVQKEARETGNENLTKFTV